MAEAKRSVVLIQFDFSNVTLYEVKSLNVGMILKFQVFFRTLSNLYAKSTT